MYGLTIAILTKNNESYIWGCLLSAYRHASEIVVIDTGSTDKTKELIQRFRRLYFKNLFVYDFPWTDSFSDARNFAIKQCHFEWILMLDSDERLVVGVPNLIEFIYAQPSDIGGFHTSQIGYQNSFCGRAVPSYGRMVRIVRNFEGLEYIYPVHEEPYKSIQKAGYEFADVAIEKVYIAHLGYDVSVEAITEKARRNMKLINQMVEAEPDNGNHLYYKAMSHGLLGELEERNKYLELALTKDISKKKRAEIERLLEI